MILVDNNISYRVATVLAQSFKGSIHVTEYHLDVDTEDAKIWSFAKEKGYTILTKDNDFEAMSRLFSCPPKVLQLTCGNKTTAEIIRILNGHLSPIQSFIADDENCLMYLQ